MAHIHDDKMYALGGVNEGGECQLDPWYFDLSNAAFFLGSSRSYF